MVSEVVKDLCQLNPFSVAFGVNGPLKSQYRRDQFLKEHLSPIEPVEYILHSSDKKNISLCTNSSITVSTYEQQIHPEHNIAKQKAI